jgi:phospholipid:diacylglycerol acyltransferase
MFCVVSLWSLPTQYDFGYRARFGRNEAEDPRTWTNPLTMQLPRAPSMKIVCYYGVGKATERAYFYDGKAQGQVR